MDLPEEYVAAFCSKAPGPQDRVLVFPLIGSTPLEISFREAQVLGMIKGVGPLEAQRYALVAESGGCLSAQDIDAALRSLVARNLLVSKEQYLKLLAEESRSSTPAISAGVIFSVAVITRERPELLLRSLESYRSLPGSTDRKLRLAVYDDGASEAAGALRSKIREFDGRPGMSLAFVGKQEKERFYQALLAETVKLGVPERTLRFGLFGDPGWEHRGGANRNWVLLDTIGEAILLSDDDETSRFFRHPEWKPGIALSSLFDPTDLYSGQAWIDEAKGFTPVKVNLLAVHEELLGKRPDAWLPDKDGLRNVEMREASPRFTAGILRRSGPILATVAGVAGDSGVGSPRGLLSLEGEARERLVGSKRSFETGIVERRVLWVARRNTVAEGPYLRAGNIGLCNRDWLPPFLPCGRNEDGVLGLLIHRCFAVGSIAHLGAAVVHEPAQTRTFRREDAYVVRIRLSDIITSLIQDAPYDPLPGDTEMALRGIGAHLVKAGHLSASGFQGYMQTLWIRQASAHIAHLESLLDRYVGQPRYWAQDVGRLIKNVEALTLKGSPWLPTDFALQGRQGPEKEASGQVQTACQNAVALFGELLSYWPEIVKAARGLRESGVSLSIAP